MMPKQPHTALEGVIKHAATFGGLCVFLIALAFMGLLGYAAWPTFSAFGLDFLIKDVWNPVTDEFGALSAIYGTLLTSAIAMLLAFPLSLGIAFFLSEIAPDKLVIPTRTLIELLAGIPSLVYGLWGLFVLAPVFQRSFQPFLIETLGQVPVIGSLFSGPAYGVGLLTAGIVLAIMILPFMTAIVTDLFQSTPQLLRESAYAMGATPWEVLRHVMLPALRQQIWSGAFLALGRALGETMAVTFVVGNAHRISNSLLAPGTTISAAIASEFNEATSDLHSASLVALGFILFIVTFFALALSQYMRGRAANRVQP